MHRSIQNLRPEARLDELVSTANGDEMLVFDQRTQLIHHLNATSAKVWRLADGTRTIDQIAAEAGGLDRETVDLALGKLAACDLLQQAASFAPIQSTSRRKLIGRAAAASAAAVPVIVSITAPASSGNGTPPPGCEAADCSEGNQSQNGNVPHPSLCDAYCACVVGGAPVQMPCSPGLHYNHDIDACDWPDNLDPPCFEGGAG